MSVHNYNHADDEAAAAMDQAAHQEVARLRAALAAAEAENKRLRKVLEQVAAPDSQSFYIIRDNTRALVAEWSAVQYRMDIARAALAKEGA